jgi:hypothetical protein
MSHWIKQSVHSAATAIAVPNNELESASGAGQVSTSDLDGLPSRELEVSHGDAV